MTPCAPQKLRGAALPLVLLLVAFNVTVLVALLLIATTELNASRNSLNTNTARIMALNGIELAGALIAENSTNNAYVTYQNIITNLPGDTNARLETKIANTVTQGNQWTRIVDNQTALHSGFAASNDEKVDLNYAVPSSTNAGDTISGYILPRTNPTNSNWRNLHTNMFQMKWVNVYKGAKNDPTNLIGRFAFWVDDESTKLNVNYSGAAQIYDGSWNWQLNSMDTYLPNSRTNLSMTNGAIAWSFQGNSWPLFLDLGGIAGIARTNIIKVLQQRGTPPSYNSPASPINVFSPFYSAMEIRSANTNVVTNISEQGQLAFTATMFSREPELSFAKGIPRFDMFRLNSLDLTNATIRQQVRDNFIGSLTNNYSRFYDKYSLPQFATSLLTFYSGPGQTTSFTYTTVGGETPVFVNKARPYLNEIEIKLNSSLDAAGNQTTRLNVAAELIFLGTARQNSGGLTQRANTMFDELAPVGSTDSGNSSNYDVTLSFTPPLEVSGQSITNAILKADPSRWFTNKSSTNGAINYVRTDSQDLTNSFAVLTNTIPITNAPTTSSVVVWKLPQQISANLTYSGDTYQKMVPADVVSASIAVTNYLTNDGNTRTLYHLTSQPRGDLGVRSDPRLGFHAVTLTNATNATTNTDDVTSNFTNNAASIGFINKTWRSNGTNSDTGPWSTNYLAAPLSPDITPPLIVFQADRGLPMINEQRHFMDNFYFLQTAADIGEIPITTFKSGQHLSWSTPRLWGDGRTNMGDGLAYPPDWLMLDCIHSVFLSPRAPTNRVFTYSANASDYNLEHLHHGRVNMNGLKSFFQKPLGTTYRADTIADSLLLGMSTKDFRDDLLPADTFGNTSQAGSVLSIADGSSARTNVLNFLNDQAIALGAANTPFLTPFEFVAKLAGNTNTNLTKNSFWMSYVPGAETTSERRIEALVKGIYQRVTTRGWQFSVYSIGQSVQVVNTGTAANPTFKTNVIGEAYMQSVWERAPKHDTSTGTIVNASPGGAPPMRMLYMREIR